ncbi:OprO/OprP family phosphate-selective porin [Planctellipticum variicoloris]|uniref:OprO/OprP family phosphate-selective porin n=1 Tax=Planctellipticum variicoloris TaxID=3064265 RepID=UPI003013BEFC|nr:porin [Planctomycetaceae bacterium SH412]
MPIRFACFVGLSLAVAGWFASQCTAQEFSEATQESEFADTTVPPEPGAADPWLEIGALRNRLDQLESANATRKAADATKKAVDAKKPTVKWSGELQADQYWFNQDEANKAQFGDVENGSDFRRARIAMFGDYGPSEYRLEMDFAQSGRPTFLDVWAGFKDIPGLGRIRVGHFFEPFSLERLTSNRFQTYMERSQVDQAFAPARNLGVGATNTVGEEEVGTWAIGLFNNNSNAYGDATGDRFAGVVTGRVTWLPWFNDRGDEFLHLGFASSYRHTGTGFVQFQAESEARLGANTPNVPFFINTGKIAARTYQLFGWEAALVKGPFSLQSEVTLTPVESTYDGGLLFYGWYVDASYFLTGEHRVYRKEFGVFDRVEPARPFLKFADTDGVEFGPGAWQVATRLSQVDLNSGAIQGGRQTDLTVGLNWYLDPYTRVYFNYVHAMIDQPVDGSSTCDSLAMRFSFDF